MNTAEAVSKLETSKEFADWKKDNFNSFLANLFAMFDKEPEGEWLVGYYNPDTKRTTTFFVDELECFKKGEDSTEAPVKQLNMGKVKVELHTALETAKAAFDKKTGESTQKTIAILQNLDIGQAWNISYMTSSFNMYNIKIDAETAKVVSEDYGALFRQA